MHLELVRIASAVVTMLFILPMLPTTSTALMLTISEGETFGGFFIPSDVHLGLRRPGHPGQGETISPINFQCPIECFDQTLSLEEESAAASGNLRVRPMAGGGVEIALSFEVTLTTEGFGDEIISSLGGDIHFTTDEPANVELFALVNLATMGSTASGARSFMDLDFESREPSIENQRISISIGEAGIRQFEVPLRDRAGQPIVLVPGDAYALNTAFLARQHYGSSGRVPSQLTAQFGLRLTPIPEPSTAISLALGLGLLSAQRRRSTGKKLQ